MIRWCAYCQTFQGEVAPLDSFEMTHGICEDCLRAGKAIDADAIVAARPLADLYRRLRAQAKAGFDSPGERLLDEASALGIRPLDLLIGMLQPVLSDIGAAWARGEVTIAAEHRFTAAVAAAASTALVRLPKGAGVRQATRPEFLLVCANGNHHTLGLKLVELSILQRGGSTFVVEPGLPSSEVIELARSLEPKVIGISVAMGNQVHDVREISASLDRWPSDVRPRLVVGGHCLKMGLALDRSLHVETCADARRLELA